MNAVAVVDEEGRLLGSVQLTAMGELLRHFTRGVMETPVEDFMRRSKTTLEDMPVGVKLSDPFLDIFAAFATQHCQTLFLLAEGDDDTPAGTPIGVITLQDAIAASIETNAQGRTVSARAVITKSWEVRKQAAKSLCTVKLLQESNVISDEYRELIWLQLPSRVRHHDWRLLYSSSVHGCSLAQLYRYGKLTKEESITVIKDSKHQQVFGCYTNLPFQPQGQRPFGNGTCFVFSFDKHSADYDTVLHCHKWEEGRSNVFMQAHPDFISIGGGGDGPAIYVDDKLLNGSTNSSETFGNDPLCHDQDFKIWYLEVWGLGWKKLRDIDEGEPIGSFFQEH